MPRGFRWSLCNYVGGDVAVNPSYKPWLAIESGDPANPGAPGQDAGEISMPAGYTGPISVSGLGFAPDVLMLTSYRPRLHNGHSDTNFGLRGGGMTFGVAGRAYASPAWDEDTAYEATDTVIHEGTQYVALFDNTGSEPPSANWAPTPFVQFTGSSRAQQGFDLHVGLKRWREDVCFNVVSSPNTGTIATPEDILTIELTSFDPDGFTLEVLANLYDQADPIAWIAMRGDFAVGTFAAGDTSLTGAGMAPTGAMFFSTKSLTEDPEPSAWDFMWGMAAENGQASVWGGARSSSAGWTTERWEDDRAILLCRPANGSFFAGTSVLVEGRVVSWDAGGVSLDWPVFDNQPYRIGYVLVGNPSEQGVIEANWEKRPGGSQNEPPGSGTNFEETTVRPYTILMTTTNYNFNMSSLDPLDEPRSPGAFWQGGGGGIAWHAYPFSSGQGDAWGVHTYSNAVSERGHYQNSGTVFRRGCVNDGAGANSQPPAAHQHGINVLPVDLIVGMNFRSADRRGHTIRGLNNVSDDRL